MNLRTSFPSFPSTDKDSMVWLDAHEKATAVISLLKALKQVTSDHWAHTHIVRLLAWLAPRKFRLSQLVNRRIVEIHLIPLRDQQKSAMWSPSFMFPAVDTEHMPTIEISLIKKKRRKTERKKKEMALSWKCTHASLHQLSRDSHALAGMQGVSYVPWHIQRARRRPTGSVCLLDPLQP